MTVPHKTVYEFGPFRLDAAKRCLKRDGVTVVLTRKAYEVLLILVQNSGVVVRKERFLEEIWPDTFVEEGSLAVNISTLRKALGEKKNEPVYIETVPRVGYIFVAEVRKVESANALSEGHEQGARPEFQASVLPQASAALHAEPRHPYAAAALSEDAQRHLEGLPVVWRKDSFGRRGVRFFRRRRVSVLSVGAVALLCLLLVMFLRPSGRRHVLTESLAVISFGTTDGNTGVDHISEGVTNSLARSLSGLPRLVLVSRGPAAGGAGQSTDPLTIGRSLGVATLLTGTVSSAGEELTITVEVVDAASAQTVWSKRYSGRTSDIFSMEREMAEDVSRQLQPGGTAGGRTWRGRGTDDPEAYLLYLKGQQLWGQRTQLAIKQGRSYFQRAVEKDPRYALAYAGLANSYFLLGVWGRSPAAEMFAQARKAATKALEIDPRSAEAHTSLAVVKWLHDWDWEEADRLFRTAIECDPRYATAPHWYGLYLAEMGRFEEALAQERRALELAPLSPPVNADMARVLYYARRYDESLEQYRKTIAMSPTFDAFYVELSHLYEQLGMNEELYATMEILGAFDNEEQRVAFHSGGFRKYWQVRAVGFDTPTAMQDGEICYHLAELNAMLGNHDRALEMLEMAYERRDHKMAQLKVNPKFDSLRRDPRFGQLLRRLRFTT